ncbi:MAG: sulfatase-like hydrolase/transferase [Halovenus sp.]
MEPQNVLFVVWDACRLDTAREYAPTLQSLAESNLWFENAITPAGHSLPAHVSLMTGAYPHQHGIFRQGQMIGSLPLLEKLQAEGYTRYGVSANGFASPKYGFDEGFDEFYNTQGQMVFPRGFDVHRYGRQVREETDGEFDLGSVSYTDLFRAVATHERPLRSAVNVAAAGITELTRDVSVLQKIPHPRFDPYSEFNYSPEKNTGLIESIVDREASTESPFFIFTNYMDTHRPYAPPAEYQREYCGRTFSYSELSELNRIARPWPFIERERNGSPHDEGTLDTIRQLYKGEVRVVDNHLERLLTTLEEAGLRQETLVVVTADHGENLGETDPMGETRIGHVASASDNLLRVPLVVAHPDLDGREVEQPVSVKDVYKLLTSGLEQFVGTAGAWDGWNETAEGIVASQVPAQANEILLDRHPDLRDVLTRHIAVCYTDSWKVVATSSGDEYAWQDGEQVDLADAPEDVVDECRTTLSQLEAQGEGDAELSESDIEHLEALGYL